MKRDIHDQRKVLCIVRTLLFALILFMHCLTGYAETQDPAGSDPQKANIRSTQAGSQDSGEKQKMLTVDEVLKMHAKACHYDKVRSVKTMKLSGKMIRQVNNGEVVTPYTLIMKRPNLRRFDFTSNGSNIVMAYDGTTVWMVNPLVFRGSMEPKEMTGPMGKQIIIDGQFFPSFSSPLIEYKERGYLVELLGTENMEGNEFYKLKATLNFGMVTYWYISTKDYLVPKFTWLPGKHDFGSKGFDVHVCLKDYKESGGIFFPHVVEDKVAGMIAQKFTVDHAEINLDIDDSIFKMPATTDEAPGS